MFHHCLLPETVKSFILNACGMVHHKCYWTGLRGMSQNWDCLLLLQFSDDPAAKVFINSCQNVAKITEFAKIRTFTKKIPLQRDVFQTAKTNPVAPSCPQPPNLPTPLARFPQEIVERIFPRPSWQGHLRWAYRWPFYLLLHNSRVKGPQIALTRDLTN